MLWKLLLSARHNLRRVIINNGAAAARTLIDRQQVFSRHG